jgi:hypothetical protein
MSDREAFEKWYMSRGWVDTFDPLVKHDHGAYIVTETCEAWEAWQAALQSGEPVVLERFDAHLEIEYDEVKIVIDPDPEGSLVYYDNVVRVMQAAPQPVVPDGFCLDIGHRRHKERTGDVCTCAKYIRHPACDKHEVRPLLPETNPLLSAGKGGGE